MFMNAIWRTAVLGGGGAQRMASATRSPIGVSMPRLPLLSPRMSSVLEPTTRAPRAPDRAFHLAMIAVWVASLATVAGDQVVGRGRPATVDLTALGVDDEVGLGDDPAVGGRARHQPRVARRVGDVAHVRLVGVAGDDRRRPSGSGRLRDRRRSGRRCRRTAGRCRVCTPPSWSSTTIAFTPCFCSVLGRGVGRSRTSSLELDALDAGRGDQASACPRGSCR